MRRRWSAATVLGATAAAVVAYRGLVRPWHERWGATDEEVRAGLVGDDLVAAPAAQCTRAITIHARPEEVWPWVVQIGAARGGFYSYDRLENLFGLGIHSADHVVPEWQQRAAGDLVFANAEGSGGWYVMDVRPNEALVLQVANLATGRPLRRDEQLRWEFTWTFALIEQADGTTRLIVRERIGFGRRITELAMAPVGLVSFVMTRPMMRGIKARAEGGHRHR